MGQKTSKIQGLIGFVQALAQGRAHPPGPGSNWFKFLHFWVLVWRSFTRNRCPVHASALAYATLLSLVPLLAVAVSITSTFLKTEGEDRIDQFIERFVSSVTPPDRGARSEAAPRTEEAHPVEVPGDQQIVTDQGRAALSEFTQDPRVVQARRQISGKIHEFIKNTRSGALGLTGSALLIFLAMSLLNRVETTFNDIWGVAHGRSWFTRIMLYWGVISLAPLLLVLAIGLATGPHLESTKQLISRLPLVGGISFAAGLYLLPILLVCLAFAAFYKLVPNTKVNWSSALIGGLAGGLLFHLNSLLNVLYVSRVVNNSKMYGGMGLVPVFMAGLYLAWLILLLGAQVAYAHQNRASYLDERESESINQRGREFVALRLVTVVGQRYAEGAAPPTISELARMLAVPTRLIQQIMRTLGSARLVTEAAGSEPAYLPARPLEAITCHDLLMAMRTTQGHELATRDEPARREVLGEYARIQEAERTAAASVSLRALVQRASRPKLSAPANQAEVTADDWTGA